MLCHLFGCFDTNISEMPRLSGISNDVFFSFRPTEDQPEFRQSLMDPGEELFLGYHLIVVIDYPSVLYSTHIYGQSCVVF